MVNILQKKSSKDQIKNKFNTMKKRLLKTKDSQLHLCPRFTRSDANTLIIIHREIVKRHFNREKRKKGKKK